ncbi:hypothetical protein [Streptacidiphilus fuscans]|uniref:hypothetical protein n=1 Tax=Streptacidiphilus fuscans TaxID=2789292 RepID=UPI001F3FC5C1|nr:hypothetical protein [Streptacidiphilus fuscans]
MATSTHRRGPSGPVTDSTSRSGGPLRRAVAGFGLPGPHREQHVLTLDQLSSVRLPIGDDGVVVGQDGSGGPAVLSLFRPRPYDVVLVGGIWTAQLIALRAAATGARVAVETGRGQAWGPVAQAAGGGQPCMTVHPIGRLGPQGATVAGPVLVVRDAGPRPGRSRLSAAPWQAMLTLMPYLAEGADRLLGSADLVGVQRVAPQEAELIARVLQLPAAEAAALPNLGDGVTLWTNRRTRSFVQGGPTPSEAQVLGQARRMD